MGAGTGSRGQDQGKVPGAGCFEVKKKEGPRSGPPFVSKSCDFEKNRPFIRLTVIPV